LKKVIGDDRIGKETIRKGGEWIREGNEKKLFD
jgi:hypothetical protein